jgi:hypothetical protein
MRSITWAKAMVLRLSGFARAQSAVLGARRTRVRAAQGVSHLTKILQVSASRVDDSGERKREAAQGLDRANCFQGENAI